jgi:hypothetical protein
MANVEGAGLNTRFRHVVSGECRRSDAIVIRPHGCKSCRRSGVKRMANLTDTEQPASSGRSAICTTGRGCDDRRYGAGLHDSVLTFSQAPSMCRRRLR